ncbi:MAG: MBL fold metallo-hydrolase [Acidobacteria bacterium]|nr:MAG: MBL fold metallo-hydrolase [Acidobacteriota bacterium]PIE89145.1 MAG: MBL fold metallo-hydrolase [Acidobacteriota bacterium]
MELLFDKEDHQNIWLDDFGHGLAVQANQHMIVHKGKAFLLDPGGHKAYNKTILQVENLIKIPNLAYVFLSHQDPDIVASINGWLITTDAEALCSALWIRFVPHFGIEKFVEHRLLPIPDEGMVQDLNGCDLVLLPAHFLHSAGNFQVYDPTSKILYSGDLGASIGADYSFVSNFDTHLEYMQGFHERYMASNAAMKAWVNMVKTLDIEMIVPQHGAAFKGAELCQRFIKWCEELQCGTDLIGPVFKVPEK